MNLAQLIPILIQISIGLVVFSIGMRAERGDLTYLLRRPALLIRSVLSMNVVMPLLAVAAALVFDLRRGVEAALILLAISPVPPVLPGKQAKGGGNLSYGIGLLTVSAALAIVTVPASVTIIGRLIGRTLDVPTMLIAKTVLISVLGPLVLGVVAGRLAPRSRERIAPLLNKVAMVVLVLVFIPVLLSSWGAITAAVGDFTLVAIVLFTVAGIAIGHLLGGPVEDDRTVLGLSTACRHPGVAIATAAAVTVADHKAEVTGAVLLAFLVAAILTAPYVKWRKRAHAASTPGAEPA